MALHPTACPLDCPDACGVLVETGPDGRFLRLRGNPAHSWSRGHLCGKTAIYHELALGPERLRQPLVRRDGALVPVSWGEALDRVARALGGLTGEDLLALHYAGNMGLVGRRYPMRVMNALGATDTDGAICDTASTVGYQALMGEVIGPDLEQVETADLLVLWGCDALRTVQHLMPRVRSLCARGVPVVVIDVYRTDTLRRVEAWGGRGLVIHPGTDAALALGLVELAFQRGDADLGYLRRECHGAAEFRAEVAGRYPLAEVAGITGLDAAEISWLSDRFALARQAWIKTGVGWNRRRNGAMSMRAVASLAAVLGIADRLHYESFDHFHTDESVLGRPDLRPADAPPPIRHVQVGQELVAGRFQAVVVWGHNPVVTAPDTTRVRAGLARDDLFLLVHELVLTETARLADVVLPATALPEHTDIFKSYGHRVMQLGRKACDAPHEQRSNVDTFRAIAERLGLERALWDVTEESLVEEFLAHNRARFSDEELTRLRAGQPVKLAPRAPAPRGTPSGRIELVSQACAAAGQPRVASYVPDDGCGLKGRFWFHSAPSVATHNSTFGLTQRHALRAGPARVLVNPRDADELRLAAGDRARLSNEQGTLTLQVELSDDLPRGMVRVDGFPDPRQTPEGLSSNALTSQRVSDMGDGNVQYSARVDLARIG